MKRQNIRSLTTIGVLGAAGASALLLPHSLHVGSASAAPMPLATDEIKVTGTVRDFKKEHVDFDVTPAGGNGHYAGNIAQTLGGSNCPVFTTTGFKVSTQWRDKDSHNIAPHLYYNSGVFQLTSAPVQSQNTVIDTWNSEDGPYGGDNVGSLPTMQIGAAMPSVSAPTGLPNQGNVNYTGTVTISTNFRCNSFTTGQNTIINISGDRTIYCTGAFTFAKNSQIILQPNSTLNLYFANSFSVGQGSQINMNTFDPDRCLMYNLGTQTMLFNQQGAVCARIVSPNAIMHLKQDDDFYGTFIGKSITLDQGGGFHWDGIPMDVCGQLVADVVGTAGVSSTGGVTSASTFNDWYHDVLGTNLSAQHTITLVKNGSGVYEYLNDEFFPIDGILFGNEGDEHNYFFTYSFSVPFVHDACGNKFFEFEGADDAWLFIGTDLAMDLGGVIPGVGQYVPMDRFSVMDTFDLVDGETYTLRFFYAQRNPTTAKFRVRTNLDLVASDVPLTASAGWD